MSPAYIVWRDFAAMVTDKFTTPPLSSRKRTVTSVGVVLSFAIST